VIADLLRLLTLQDANTRTVLLGTALLGVAAGVVGVFAVLRRRALMGDAVAHAALPGVCVAYLVMGDRQLAGLLLGALVVGALSVVFITLIRSRTRIKEDAAIALVIGGFFGLGIVLSRIIQNLPSSWQAVFARDDAAGTAGRSGLDGFIFGKAASMVVADAWLISGVAAAVVLAVVLCYKELKVLCFDEGFAAGQGWPVTRLDLGVMFLVCVCTVVGLPAVGVVLMVSLLVIPAAAARLWSHRLDVVVCLAGLFGAMSGLVGSALSATLPAPPGALSRGWPTGPLITLTAAGIFAVSFAVRMARNLLDRSAVVTPAPAAGREPS
jgi:manganese/zinc/iron transport system permease protein